MLDFLFEPRGVAVVGATESAGKIGRSLMENLAAGGYAGRVYPVNPRGGSVFGLEAYRSVLDIPGDVDLALVAVPRAAVEDVIRECGQRGIAGAVVITAGYKESGPEGAAAEGSLRAVAAEAGVRIVGPNCLGVLSLPAGLNGTFAGGTPPRRGNAAVVSQSGAVGTALFGIFEEIGVGFSRFVSIGNRCDVDEAELLEYLAEDEATKVVCMYIESVADGRRFLEAARKVTRRKPLVVLKAGTSLRGAAAASSHTGSLAGSDAAYAAAFRAARAMQVLTLQDLSELTAMLAAELVPSADGVVVLTNAGGPGILAADAAERWGVRMAELSAETRGRLASALPGSCSTGNPVDVLGDATAERYRAAAEVLAADDTVETVLMLLTAQSQTEPLETARAAREALTEKGVPVVASFVGGSLVEPAREELRRMGIPNADFPERAMKLLGYTHQVHGEENEEHLRPSGMDLAAIRTILDEARAAGRDWLPVDAAFDVLRLAGVNVPFHARATTATEAVAFAEACGYPVSLKVMSDDIVHKSDVGGVRLKLQSAAEVRAAYRDMLEAVRQAVPEARIDGVLVSEHVRGGRELIVGSTRDATFGPLAMFGVGGVWVEAAPDVTFRMAPVNADEAFGMVRDIRSARMLGSFRGKRPADLNAVADVISRVSYLASAVEGIADIEVNPLMALYEGEGVVAADVRVRLS